MMADRSPSSSPNGSDAFSSPTQSRPAHNEEDASAVRCDYACDTNLSVGAAHVYTSKTAAAAARAAVHIAHPVPRAASMSLSTLKISE